MTRDSVWKPEESADNERRLDYSVTERIVDEIYGSRYQFLANAALQRISEINEYYEYYDLEGQYWEMPHTLGYTPTIMPVNLARWFIRKRKGWMFEVAPDVECPPKRVDDTEAMETVGYIPSEAQKAANDSASARESLLYRNWTENRFEEKLLEAGNDFFVGGTVALKLRYLPNKGIKLNFSPAQEVFPIPSEDDPDSFDAVHFCSYLDNDKTIWKQTWELVDGKCYLTEATYDLKLEPRDVRHNRVDTKLDFIPVLIFPRDCLTGSMYGTSYLRDLIPLFDQYNRSLSDAADSLRFNLFSVIVMLNAAPDSERKLKVAPGAIWNVGGDGPDVKKLESSFQYAGALADFLTRLENLMHLLADVPDVTPDRIKGFGLVSGVALKLLYSDLVSATQQDWRVWKSRLVLMNEYILRMTETYDLDGASDIGGVYDNRIIPHLPLPENIAEQVAVETQKVAAGMQTVRKALIEFGDKFPERTIAEMLTERARGLGPQQPISIGAEEQISGA
jgi:hypothetical protein